MKRLVVLLEKKVRTEGDIEPRIEMILCQEYQPGTTVDIAIEPNIDRRWVSRVIDQDLLFEPLTKRKVQKFTDLNIEKHMLHSRKLLSNLTLKALKPAFFSGEKIFKVEKTL